MKSGFILLAGMIYLFVFFGLFRIFQNEKIYDSGLGAVFKQYELVNDTPTQVDKPYTRITNENLITWDALHFHNIKEKLYENATREGGYSYAFFPLFPLIWRILDLSSKQMMILNYFLFIAGLFIISQVFKINYKKIFVIVLLLISFPVNSVFMIPYAESVLFFFFAVFIYGYIKNKKWLVFMGLFLVSLTRPSIFILATGLFGTELFLFLKYKKDIKKSFINLAFLLTPVVLGTIAVFSFQFYFDRNNFFKYFEAMKLWGNKFQIPQQLTDWSHEGYGLNIASFFLLVVPVLFYFLSQIKFFFHKVNKENNSKEYLFILSGFNILITGLYILFFQGGNLHGMFRYLACTPYFYFLAFYFLENNIKMPVSRKFIFYLILLMSGLSVFLISGYSRHFNHSDFGFFLLFLSVIPLIFKPEKRYYFIFILIIVLLNIIWNTYMLNSFINKAWVFT